MGIRKKISFPNDVESEHWIDRIDRTERAMLPSYAITCYFINSSTRSIDELGLILWIEFEIDQDQLFFFSNEIESEHWIDRIDRTERAMLPSYAITCYFINSSTR